MTKIRSLFDEHRGIQRSIEKVITYQAAHEDRLKSEISEYIVTDSIDRQMERLLESMQAAIDSGGGHEVGVWVSGFYGSGKSSFTKYLGLALDPTRLIDGQPFLKHLNDRLQRPQTKALLNKVAGRMSAAVVMLDLASQQIAGASLSEVSTVLFHRVLQSVGYARNRKVAALERKLKKEGRFEEFEKLFEDQAGLPWQDLHNDDLVVDSLLPALAHKIYPELFPTEQAFSTVDSDTVYLMDDQVREMIDVVREETGRDNVIFVVDEVGQYVGSDSNKILNLDGLAKNIKDIGAGKVWIMATAQQTLTEDDQRIALNSTELFKLQARFPISVELEASDIREICYRRLLSKSSDGEKRLGDLFDGHGQALRHHTKLADAKYYDSNFDRTTFINLYPFLPAHFEILLRLLGALAKSTGGVGLRSAIKVIQDVLIEGVNDEPPIADREVGWLATTVTLYDSLERDIRRAFPALWHAVDTVKVRFPDEGTVQGVAKTIAVLQILDSLPVTVENVAALMHAEVAAASALDAVKEAVEAMRKSPFVTLGEKDGSLRFFSEKLNDVERERDQLPLRSGETQRIFNTALGTVFDPPPKAVVDKSLTVTTGIKRFSSGRAVALAGDREPVQTVVVFTEPAEYDGERTKLLEESRVKASDATVFLLARLPDAAMERAGEIFRCHRIAELHRTDPDQEVKDYCASQMDMAAKLETDLQLLLARSLVGGSFVFRGAATAVESLDQSLLEASRKHLGDVAKRVFEHYGDAAVRVDTGLPEKFLRAPSLAAITSQIDPLGLVQKSGGSYTIRTDIKALDRIRDYLDRNGVVEGRRLLEVFSGAPYGWAQDTMRYLVAALLMAAEIKLKLGGREVTVNGQQAIEALKSNVAFKAVGVSLREDRPSIEMLARAAERLRDLSGEDVHPLEEKISKAAHEILNERQNKLASVRERLASLDLPGLSTMEAIGDGIERLLQTDASEAPQVFGAEDSQLYDDLKWAWELKLALEEGLEITLRRLRGLERDIVDLPGTGIPGTLRDGVRDDLEFVTDRLQQHRFFDHAADLATRCTAIETAVSKAATDLADDLNQRLKRAEGELAYLSEWSGLREEEQQNALDSLRALKVKPQADIAGLKALVAKDFDIGKTIEALKRRIVDDVRARWDEAKPEGVEDKKTETLAMPEHIASMADLDALIARLQRLRAEISYVVYELKIGED